VSALLLLDAADFSISLSILADLLFAFSQRYVSAMLRFS
jgi:hypothetical protein